jgi:hypothetical protein
MKRTEDINKQVLQNNKAMSSFMFKSQAERFEDPKTIPADKRRFHAKVTKDNIYFSDGDDKFDKLDKSRNRNNKMIKKLITFGREQLGFNQLSPRFPRTSTNFKPGPGEYLIPDLNSLKLQNSKEHISLKESKLLSKYQIKTNLQTPHSYTGHSTLLKKTFNKLLTPRDEEYF